MSSKYCKSGYPLFFFINTTVGKTKLFVKERYESKNGTKSVKGSFLNNISKGKEYYGVRERKSLKCICLKD